MLEYICLGWLWNSHQSPASTCLGSSLSVCVDHVQVFLGESMVNDLPNSSVKIFWWLWSSVFAGLQAVVVDFCSFICLTARLLDTWTNVGEFPVTSRFGTATVVLLSFLRSTCVTQRVSKRSKSERLFFKTKTMQHISLFPVSQQILLIMKAIMRFLLSHSTVVAKSSTGN